MKDNIQHNIRNSHICTRQIFTNIHFLCISCALVLFKWCCVLYFYLYFFFNISFPIFHAYKCLINTHVMHYWVFLQYGISIFAHTYTHTHKYKCIRNNIWLWIFEAQSGHCSVKLKIILVCKMTCWSLIRHGHVKASIAWYRHIANHSTSSALLLSCPAYYPCDSSCNFQLVNTKLLSYYIYITLHQHTHTRIHTNMHTTTVVYLSVWLWFLSFRLLCWLTSVHFN